MHELNCKEWTQTLHRMWSVHLIAMEMWSMDHVDKSDVHQCLNIGSVCSFLGP